MRSSLFKVNYSREMKMGFEIRKKEEEECESGGI